MVVFGRRPIYDFMFLFGDSDSGVKFRGSRGSHAWALGLGPWARSTRNTTVSEMDHSLDTDAAERALDFFSIVERLKVFLFIVK